MITLIATCLSQQVFFLIVLLSLWNFVSLYYFLSMLKGKENPNHRKFNFEYPYLATMACTENISGDITVFMGSYKLVNVIVEFYNTTREFR